MRISIVALRPFGIFCILSIVFGLVLTDAFGESAAVNGSEDVVPLRLKTGMVTQAEFPERIADVTKSVSSDFLQVETLGNRMFLLPLKSFDSYLHVVTEDNISYCLHLIMDNAETPTSIEIKKRPQARKQTKNQGTFNTVELMRILLKEEEPPGAASVRSGGQEVFNNGVFRISTDKVYELGGGAKALVLRFENLMDKPIVLPIENIELPGLVAVSVDAQILGPRPRSQAKNSSDFMTKAYMIIEAQDH
jgi:hypothetical protein